MMGLKSDVLDNIVDCAAGRLSPVLGHYSTEKGYIADRNMWLCRLRGTKNLRLGVIANTHFAN